MTASASSPIHQYAYDSARRVGIPTAESALGISDALAEAESAPEPYTEAYPTLRWQRGVDAQSVRYGKLFIHDKVSPAEFVASLLKDPAQQGNWFHDFNNLPPNAHFEPYEHRDGNWNNRLIKSAAQRVMPSLLEHEGMAGQVDLIYMDPPYNINFRSNFQGLVDDANAGDGWQDIPLDVRHTKVFRDSYRNGVHTYLDQLRAQLLHGRELLKESGSFVMQIGPDNLHYVGVLMSEVFGHENHVATIPYTTATNNSTRMLPEIGNWLIWFAKSKTSAKFNQIYEKMELSRDLANWARFSTVCELPSGEERQITADERANPRNIPEGTKIYVTYGTLSEHNSFTGRSDTFYLHTTDAPCPNHGWDEQDRANASQQPHLDHLCNESCDTPLPDNWDSHQCTPACHRSATRMCPKGRKCGPACTAIAYPCPTGKQWRVSLKGLHASAVQGRITQTANNIRFKSYFHESPGWLITSDWHSIASARDKPYIVETPPTVLRRILLMTTDPGDLVLDPTCGSGAMPLMAERWGRRWIAVDSSAVSIAVARQRIATAVHPYWLLQDSPEGHRREQELEMGLLPPEQRAALAPAAVYRNDPAGGFVLARQQRVSAATLAYGPKPGDIIRHPDRPEADGARRRVSSAFTVESDLPFTAVSAAAPERADAALSSAATAGETRRAIEQSLEKAGIRMPAGNGQRPHTYRVHGLEPTVEIPGATHTGVVVDAAGADRSALFYICREDEVAGPFQTRSLSRAARGRGDDYAVVISFGREGDTGSVQEAQGSLSVLQVIANRDHMIPGLAVKPDDNALVVISEPDLTLHRETDGQVSVAVAALTVYNPATGQVETQDSRSIVAILTDTDYDTESFRVRLWNLPRQGTTSERRLRQIRDAFKAELDEDKWERMRSSRTLPFPAPAGRTIAVKVIDHTGMEHMKVLTV